ncbi:methyltransferase domain-containing protein [Spirillospora sp. CA-128828]|uniref:TRM11 family SAM-dependent methyltransferase n=1 Tax=Spirillospora sp. CA-128828 TaxID=3240033 RepID=UPI003D92F88B
MRIPRPCLVARCVRGLESAVAAEVLESGLGAVTRLGHREVQFRLRSPEPIPVPRTADDLFLLAARRPDIGTTKSDLHALAELAELADTDLLLRLRRTLTQAKDDVPGIDVSASFLGRRTFSRYDAEDVVGAALAERLGVPYHSRRAGAAPPPGHQGWRLTLDGTHATLMLRISDRPLHRRAYKRRTVPGTLHPPVAAAMAVMADIRPGHTVLDPCCGAGTLLIEAALARPGARLRGFDLSPDAVAAARANAAALPIGVDRCDAGRLPFSDASIDRVLSNPPWGTQVHPRGLLADSPSRWWTELRRVLSPDGTVVLLLPTSETLAGAIRHGLAPVHIQGVRVSGAQSFIVRLQPTS